MRISSVNNYIKFGHKEWVQPQTFDGDDTLFQNERNNIRERILECLPYATRNTNDALILNNLFNPKTQLLGGNPVEYKKPYFIALYDNLTKQDKERLGITPEFEAEKRATLQPDYNDIYYADKPWLLN